MKLDRSTNPDGRGKYALVLTRTLRALPDAVRHEAQAMLDALETLGVVDWGAAPESAFFVIRLKDQNAERALTAYADSAEGSDSELASDVRELARRASDMDSKMPD